MKCLIRKPKKLIDYMFEVLSHEDLLAVAKTPDRHCAQDQIERALWEYRSPARERNKNFGRRCDIGGDQQQHGAERGNGPDKNAAGEEDADIGTKATGSKEDTDSRPNEDTNNGTNEDVDNGPNEVEDNADTGPSEADPNDAESNADNGPNDAEPSSNAKEDT